MISLCAPAVRTHVWDKFVNSVIGKNDINLEIIFVGPNPPTQNFPNFRFIQTNVKPSQCTHIAFTEAKGEYIHLTADDAEYESGAFDKVMEFMKGKPDNFMGGFRQFENGEDTTDKHALPHSVKTNDSLLLSPFFVIKKSIYEKLGGYDNRFLCGQAENDFSFRVLENGGIIQICNEAVVHVAHNEKHVVASSYREFHLRESDLLWEIWNLPRVTGIPYEIKRASAVQSYTNDDLLIRSQGTKEDLWD
jgi:hypothetical protein